MNISFENQFVDAKTFHTLSYIKKRSFYTALSARIWSGLEISMAFCIATLTLNQRSFSSYLRCKRTVFLLSEKKLSVNESKELQKNFQMLLDSAQTTNFWVQKKMFFPHSGGEKESVLILQRIFKAWSINLGAVCLGSDQILRTSKEQLKNLYDCLKFYETSEKYKDTLPVGTLFPKFQKIGKDVRQQIDLFKDDKLQGGRKLIFHQRSSFALLGAQSAMLNVFNVGLKNLHVAFIENNDESKILENRHVTFSKYESKPVRDLEVIGSDILEMDIMNLIPSEVKTKLYSIKFPDKDQFDSEPLSFYLNKIFAEALRTEQTRASQGHIQNNTWVRLKTLFVSSKTKKAIYDYPLEGSMQCCCFVAVSVFRAIERVNKECQSILSTDKRVVEYPFDPYINPEGLTPTSLKQLLNPMCRLIRKSN